jgi:hypothetical protein
VREIRDCILFYFILKMGDNLGLGAWERLTLCISIIHDVEGQLRGDILTVDRQDPLTDDERQRLRLAIDGSVELIASLTHMKTLPQCQMFVYQNLIDALMRTLSDLNAFLTHHLLSSPAA